MVSVDEEHKKIYIVWIRHWRFGNCLTFHFIYILLSFFSDFCPYHLLMASFQLKEITFYHQPSLSFFFQFSLILFTFRWTSNNSVNGVEHVFHRIFFFIIIWIFVLCWRSKLKTICERASIANFKYVGNRQPKIAETNIIWNRSLDAWFGVSNGLYIYKVRNSFVQRMWKIDAYTSTKFHLNGHT